MSEPRSFRRHFPDGRYPATTTIATPIGLTGARVEVEAVAAVGEKTIAESDRTYRGLPGQDPYSQAVKVAIESNEGSWLRRFTRPSYPEDVDRSRIGLELEQLDELGHLVFLSSQAPFDAGGDLVGEGDAAAQARQVFANVAGIAEACGGKLSGIVQIDFYLEGAQYYEDFNAGRIRACEQGYPDKNWSAGSGISGRSLVPGTLVEMEAIGAMG